MENDIDSDDAANAVQMATLAAEFAGRFLTSRHRGALDCGDHVVVFGNDGYMNDPHSRREAEIVLEHLKDDSPAFGINEDGITWAVVITDYERQFLNATQLGKVVWNAWMTACDEVVEREVT